MNNQLSQSVFKLSKFHFQKGVLKTTKRMSEIRFDMPALNINCNQESRVCFKLLLGLARADSRRRCQCQQARVG